MALRRFYNNTYTGLFSELPVSAITGTFFMSEDTEDVYGYNSSNLPFIVGGGGGLISVTKSELDALITGSTVEVGSTYKVTGVDSILYDGNNVIYTKGLTVSAITENCYGEFVNPIYPTAQGQSIFVDGDAYISGDTVIWGGKWYENTNSASTVSNSVDNFVLGAEWDLLSFSGNPSLYNTSYDEIFYDYSEDRVLSRYERMTNNFYAWEISPFGNLVSPLNTFQWGNPMFEGQIGKGNPIFRGKYNITVENAIFENINTIGGQYNITMTNRSYILTDTTVDELSEMSNMVLRDGAYLDSITLVDSKMKHITLTDESYISYCGFQDMFIEHINCSFHSWIDTVFLTGATTNSGFSKIDVSFGSSISEMTANAAGGSALNISDFVVKDNSSFYSLLGTNPVFIGVEVSNYSYLGEVDIADNSFFDFRVTNYSNIDAITQTGNTGNVLYDNHTENFSYTHSDILSGTRNILRKDTTDEMSKLLVTNSNNDEFTINPILTDMQFTTGTTSGSTTISDSNYNIYLIHDNGSSVDTYNVNLPLTPKDKQLVNLSTVDGLTNLTISAQTGTIATVVTSITAGESVNLIYRTANTKWYKV
jgi:hypothetical protein